MANTRRVVITAPDAPAAVGPYSHAVKANGMLYVSGQIGLVPGGGSVLAGESVEAQTEQALKNLEAILRAAGCGFSDVVKTTILLADSTEHVLGGSSSALT